MFAETGLSLAQSAVGIIHSTVIQLERELTASTEA